ncbi:MAG: SpaA isopeptide-forming pilin-related protein, partial [Peptoniphilaceae bacterium]|nr:SpaA isopeptide-forming pilin-related protein [Peptoniphilaceae bacterium]
MKKIKEKVLNFFEISSKLKRVGSFALAFLLSFLAIAPSLKAVSGSSEWIPGFYYKASGGTYGQMTRLYIGGEDVFCLEPGKVFIDGEYSQGNVSSVLSLEQRRKIELIHHFGYVLNGKSDRNRVFTQIAIWETVGGYVSVGSSNGSNNLRGEYESWLSNVNNQINMLFDVPSWTDSTVKGKVGQTITLNGEGKISGSIVLRNAGSSVWAEDGKIKIKVTENSQNGSVILQKRPAGFDEAKGITLVYQKSGSQKVGKIRLDVDPPEYRVNLEVEKTPTKARVLKVGEAGEKVPGTVFEKCYDKDFKSSTVYTFTTDKDGYTAWDTWSLQGRTVYVREKSVPYPYIKSDEIKSFKVTDGGVVELKFVNKKEEKSSIQIEKLGEENEKVAGAEFEISKTKDFKKISLVKTGKNGLSNLKEFINEIGTTIYIREKSVPYPYEKSTEVKSIKLKKGLNSVTFVNKKKRATVEISKQSVTGSKELPGATLKLLNGAGKLIEKWVSGNTPHIIKNLKDGKYSLIEEISPVGHIIASKIDFILKAGETKKVVMKDDTTKV